MISYNDAKRQVDAINALVVRFNRSTDNKERNILKERIETLRSFLKYDLELIDFAVNGGLQDLSNHEMPTLSISGEGKDICVMCSYCEEML